MVLNHQLVRSDANVERILFTPALTLQLSLLLRAEVCQHLQTGTPALELHLPVNHDRCGDDNEVRTPNPSVASKRGQQRNRLNRFTETHLIC